MERLDRFVEDITGKIDSISSDCKHIRARQIKSEIAAARPSLERVQKSDSSFSDFIRGADATRLEIKSFLSSEDSAGAAIQPHLYSKIMNQISQISPVRQLASTETISTSSLDVIIESDEFACRWASEQDVREETENSNLQRKKILVHEIYAQPKASSTLLADSHIDIENWIIERLRDAFAFAESESFISGDGQGRPFGIVSRCADDAVEVDDISIDSMIYFINSLAGIYKAKATMLMHSSTLSELQKLRNDNGSLIWQHSMIKPGQFGIFGMPIKICDHMPSFESKAGIIAFADFKAAYKIVDRSGMSIMRDPYTEKSFVKFYATRRVGADVVNNDAIKLMSIK